MPEKRIYIVGDSHSQMLRSAAKGIELSNVTFMPFGAVKQSVKPHHRISSDLRSIQLLEENWQVKSLPISADDMYNDDVHYYISLPFNVFPLARRIDTQKYTISPLDTDRAYLSKNAQDVLFERRNKLAIGLIADMVKIGLKVTAVESPRPFVDAPLSEFDNDTVIEISNRYYRRTREDLVAVGARVVGQPQSTMDQSGQTLAKYRSEADNQHGTAEFYSLLLNDILADAAPFKRHG